jgi:TolB protein
MEAKDDRVFEFGEFRLDTAEHVLLRANGETVALTPKAIETLVVLIRRSGHVVTKDELMSAVWADTFVEENSLTRNISSIRKALAEVDRNSTYIETIPKIGYRFAANVNLVGFESAQPQSVDESSLYVSRFRVNRLLLLVAFLAAAGIALAVLNWREPQPAPISALPEPESNIPIRLTFGPGNSAYPVWHDDGRIRYQHYGTKKTWEPYVMGPDGTNQIHVEESLGIRQGTWSPDGKRVFFWKENDRTIYLADADGKNERKLPFDAGNMSWSLDGDHIVYQSVVSRDGKDDWEIFTYDLETEKIVNVTNDPGFDADPSFSPDGRQIVFNSDRSGNFEIYLINTDATGLRQLTDHPAWESHPVFSPDGTLIVFNSNRENENYDLFLMSTDGKGITKLTQWESDEQVEPGCWSPDGTQIAFVSNHSGNDDIYVTSVEQYRPGRVLFDEHANIGAADYSPDGKEIVYQAELADKSGELRVFEPETNRVRVLAKTFNGNLRPAWSPMGDRIAFQNKDAGKTSLFLVDADGRNLIKLADDNTMDTVPSWSPDGTRLVFVADSFGRNQLYTVAADGRDRRSLTAKPGWEGDPALSPNGESIAFSCDRMDVPGDGLDICIANAEGSNERRLLFRRGHDIQPSWSPDGSRLVFVANSDGNSEIYMIKADGTGLTRLTRHLAADSTPHWSPDGKRIVFTSDRGGKSAIYEITIQNS